jgi:hypothetical protein
VAPAERLQGPALAGSLRRYFQPLPVVASRLARHT